MAVSLKYVVPVGAIDGTNAVFRILEEAYPESVTVNVNGVDLQLNEFTVQVGPSPDVLIITLAQALPIGDSIVVGYEKVLPVPAPILIQPPAAAVKARASGFNARTVMDEIAEWLDEPLPDSRLLAALNDAIESLWLSLVKVNISMSIGGPVDLHFTTPSSMLISITDPLTAPTISDVAAMGSTPAAHTVRAAYTYVTESGTETLLSPVATRAVPAGRLAVIQYPTQISGVFGWNCYASSTAGGFLILANDLPLGWDAYFTEPVAGFAHDPNGVLPPIENTTGDDLCAIRHMEAFMPDSGLHTYTQTDVHSLLMRRMGRSIGSSSQYQHYAFDFINQRQVEIRPAPRTQIDARVFYVKRPRRLKFDNAPLPFISFPSMGFLRDYSMGKLSLSIREFESAKGWMASAEAERARMEMTLIQMSVPKVDFITPGI